MRHLFGEGRTKSQLVSCILELVRADGSRPTMGFDHFKVALSVGVMKMVRSEHIRAVRRGHEASDYVH